MRKSISYIEQAIDRFPSASALARHIGVTPPTLHNWMQRGHPVWKTRGLEIPLRWEDIFKAAHPIAGSGDRKSTRHGLRKKELQDVPSEQSSPKD